MGNFKLNYDYKYCSYCNRKICKWMIKVFIRDPNNPELKLFVRVNFDEPFISNHLKLGKGGSTFIVYSCSFCLKRVPELRAPWVVEKKKYYSDLRECMLCDRENPRYIEFSMTEEGGNATSLMSITEKGFLKSLVRGSELCTYSCKRCYRKKIPNIMDKYSYNNKKVLIIKMVLYRMGLYKDVVKIILENLYDKVYNNNWNFNSKLLVYK